EAGRAGPGDHAQGDGVVQGPGPRVSREPLRRRRAGQDRHLPRAPGPEGAVGRRLLHQSGQPGRGSSTAREGDQGLPAHPRDPGSALPARRVLLRRRPPRRFAEDVPAGGRRIPLHRMGQARRSAPPDRYEVRPMHDVVDLRSDTLTVPTQAMREAMARAEVGDDVWEEDPTVRRLEEMAARRTGKETALFVSSGTQGNLVSVLAQTRPGQEAVLDADSHIFNYEGAGAAVFGGVQTLPVKTQRGFLTPEPGRGHIRPNKIPLPLTGLVSRETPHTRHGGTCCTPEEIEAVAAAAHAAGVPVHLDGARIFNAAVALKRPVADFARPVDSLTFCLSKGLGAPVGSLVCGSRDFIAPARRVRKLLGGGMRQVGVLAAAGLVALDTMVERLAEDHANARRLAEGVARLPQVRLDLSRVQTNIVILHVDRAGGAGELVTGSLARKVKIHQIGPAAIRCVTHKDVDADDVDRALGAVAEITAPWRQHTR